MPPNRGKAGGGAESAGGSGQIDFGTSYGQIALEHLAMKQANKSFSCGFTKLADVIGWNGLVQCTPLVQRNGTHE
jgi:hypothetical protein